MKKQLLVAVVCATVALYSISAARAADADVTGLEPTVWLDFETKPTAEGLAKANGCLCDRRDERLGAQH